MPVAAPQHQRIKLGKAHTPPAERRLINARRRSRALPTNSVVWRRLRATILAEEPLCRTCLVQRRITVATDVDHIDGDSANNSANNLQSLCHACHSRKTYTHDGAFGRSKTKVAR